MPCKNECNGCEESIPNPKSCIEKQRCARGLDIVFCDGCNGGFDWKKLPDESVRVIKEYHGQPYLSPEIIPVGFTCPECGEYNEF